MAHPRPAAYDVAISCTRAYIKNMTDLGDFVLRFLSEGVARLETR